MKKIANYWFDPLFLEEFVDIYEWDFSELLATNINWLAVVLILLLAVLILPWPITIASPGMFVMQIFETY